MKREPLVSGFRFVLCVIGATLLAGCKHSALVTTQPISWVHHVSPAAEPQWYTCYVKNRGRTGLWSGTSHRRFHAKARAFNRCHRFSGKPATCYFSYCRRW
ncbi:hypothetical protein [Coxiella burnetii]|uniref:hypothetical protein n=1 Tax=Coxiella burnetii TaxID=777 RepID=UPI00016314F6|nr:hypothetical protein [Coxiella burnetii]ACJ20095.1 lipoprotein [Coxiella burnetii CbuK_Q154]EDQ95051.1 hypothetical protein A35_04325 [Coxiella burnetii 'MSU Goat Q177']UYK70564.1 hypothetical protein OHM78_04910 [Coxiella burnetii]